MASQTRVSAVNQGERYRRKFLNLFNNGMKYANAANEVMDLLASSSSH